MESYYKSHDVEHMRNKVKTSIRRINQELQKLPRSEFKKLDRKIPLGKNHIQNKDSKNNCGHWFDFLQIKNTLFSRNIEVRYAPVINKYCPADGVEYEIPEKENFGKFPSSKKRINDLDIVGISILFTDLQTYLIKLTGKEPELDIQ